MTRPETTDVLATAAAFRDALAKVVAALLPDANDRDDVVQETILRLMESDLGSIRNVEAWMTTVATRIALDGLRVRKAAGSDVVSTASEERDPIAVRDLQQLAICLSSHLGHLDDEERRLLEDADTKGRPREELAAEAGLSVKGLNSRIRRARQRLRGLFAACCRTEHDDGGSPVGLVPRGGDECSCQATTAVESGPAT